MFLSQPPLLLTFGLLVIAQSVSASSSTTLSRSATTSRSTTLSESTSNLISSVASHATNLPLVCAGGLPASRIITTKNKFEFAVCLGTDLQGGDDTVVGNIKSIEQLAEDCSQRLSCLASSWEKVFNFAYRKVVLTVSKASEKVDSIVRISSGPPPDPAERGIPVIPVAVFLVSEKPRITRLLAFSAFEPLWFGGAKGRTQFAEYNIETGAVSHRNITNTHHEMFCPGISTLQDGRVVISGGTDANRTSIYDPKTNNFIAGPNMQIARGYQSSATLSDGKIFTLGGSWDGPVGVRDGEVYDSIASTWTRLPGAVVQPSLTQDEVEDKRDNHQWFFSWRNESIFQAGPSKQMNWYWGSGSGRVQSVGARDTEDAMCGIFAVYDALRGKIVTAAGTPSYDHSTPNRKAFHMTIDAPGAPPTVERLPDLAQGRAFANAIILPDGTVLITGGQTYSKSFTDEGSIFVPELFDPATKTFRQLAAMKVPRNYHSTAILLPDGRVFSAGGGLCRPDGKCAKQGSDHPDAEIFSPPYLFNQDGSEARRPVIATLSSNVDLDGYFVRPGGILTLTLAEDQPGVKFSFVRVGTNTHSVNTDQRRVPLEDVRKVGNMYTLALPHDTGILTPGDWYMFAISAEGGTPSVSRTVNVMFGQWKWHIIAYTGSICQPDWDVWNAKFGDISDGLEFS
ncbi:galactose oxidase [Leptodontidium sp. MPI-SDFR-AT-0119]|nr:galactose oxidase [Leptodontidium sp. MPI-SDFR-AT-0119]